MSNVYLRCFAPIFHLLLLFCMYGNRADARGNSNMPVAAVKAIDKQPLLFVENKGQVASKTSLPEDSVLYVARHRQLMIFITRKSIHYQFVKQDIFSTAHGGESRLNDNKISTSRFTVELRGSNPKAEVFAENPASYTEHYYNNTHANGLRVNSYNRIVIKNVYPHIDWVIYSKPQTIDAELEYDFIVHENGDPAQIKWAIKDAVADIQQDGSLSIKTALGVVKEKAPVAYDAEQKKLPSRFVKKADGNIGFSVADNGSRPLRIDPEVSWATYYGGSNVDHATSCMTDKNGNVYMVGTAASAGLALGGFQMENTAGSRDALLVKFAPNGERIWATYFGGSADDEGFACAMAPDGSLYIAGRTASPEGIAYNGFQNSSGGEGGMSNDAFLAKFTPEGERVWSTYYGGFGWDEAKGCAVDKLGNVYVSGLTESTDNIAAGGYQNTYGGGLYDAFIVKFNAEGNRLWASYYGGNNYDQGFGCAVDFDENVYLCGRTRSSTGIYYAGFRDSTYIGHFLGYQYGFLVKFNKTGVRQWGTYYGAGGSADAAFDCTVDKDNNIYLTGQTSGYAPYSPENAYMAYNGYQMTHGGNTDAFLAKFNAGGTRIWSTYYGGIRADYAEGCTTDRFGNVYLVGSTISTNQIAHNGVQNNIGRAEYFDAFLVKFRSNGAIAWGTYYGGPNNDYGTGCAADSTGNVYLAGQTTSESGIAVSGIDNTYGGSFDAFLLKIGEPPTIYSFTGSGNWSNPAGWINGLIPPSEIGPGHRVIINPPAGSSCTLDIPLRLLRGGELIIAAGASFIIPDGIAIAHD